MLALAGASGFVGNALRRMLPGEHEWVALTRSVARSVSPDAPNTHWRQCDLFSLPKVEVALRGADVAIYMVHSMLPSSRLVQGSFRDMDLLLADNFVRGAEAAGVRRIIYLGGLIPTDLPEAELSEHLASRLEVEQVLTSRSIPVAVLRAGLIFGPGGSSAKILLNLARRLPVLPMLRWTRNHTQSIDIRDVVRAIEFLLKRPDLSGVFDLAGHPVMTYGDMIAAVAAEMGRQPAKFALPFNMLKSSRRWVSLLSGVPSNLVNPLLESLRHSIIARPNPVLEAIQADAVPFTQSVRNSIDSDRRPLPNPRKDLTRIDHKIMHSDRRVRSVQRMKLPPDWRADDVAKAYADWLTLKLRVIKVTADAELNLNFQFLHSRLSLLRLSPTPYSTLSGRRRAFYITGGMLALPSDPPGRLEFRVFPELGCVIAGIHAFAPRLPWYIYRYSQAIVHLTVMDAFSRHLRELSERMHKAEL